MVCSVRGVVIVENIESVASKCLNEVKGNDACEYAEKRRSEELTRNNDRALRCFSSDPRVSARSLIAVWCSQRISGIKIDSKMIVSQCFGLRFSEVLKTTGPVLYLVIYQILYGEYRVDADDPMKEFGLPMCHWLRVVVLHGYSATEKVDVCFVKWEWRSACWDRGMKNKELDAAVPTSMLRKNSTHLQVIPRNSINVEK